MPELEGHFLHRFFYPESVAVVGVSRDPNRINHNLLANLVNLGFPGKIYPVNPGIREILGLRCHVSIRDIDGPVDLAVVAVPYTKAPEVLEDCVAKGVSAVTIVAGGFSETGETGRRAQEHMADLLDRHGIRAIGPNALSPINTSANLAISFHRLERLLPGGLSLIFQSGLYEPRLEWLFSAFNLRLAKLIDLGNKMDINEVDALEYLARDPATRVIGIHLESIVGDPRRFLALIRQATAQKHVVVLKSGRTEAGAKAAASHTGAMVVGNDPIFDAAIRQCGAIRAQNIEEFFDISRALERFGSLRLRGNRIALATLPGGEAVIVTDLCQQEGLVPARVGEDTRRKLSSIFPPWEIPANPFDLGVSIQFGNVLKVYDTLIHSMIEDPCVDGLAVQISSAMRDFPRDFFQPFIAAARARRPIVVWAAGLNPGEAASLRWLEDHQVPLFPTPEKAIRALAVLYRSCRRKKEDILRAGPEASFP